MVEAVIEVQAVQWPALGAVQWPALGAVQVRYVEQGDGVPVLYVHGNTGSLRWYERVMDIPGCRTVALDMPNFGGSGPLPVEPDLDRYADWVAGFIRARGLDRPVLVGHSLGGGVCLSLVARFPDLVRGMILVDSAGPSGLVTPEDHYPFIEVMRTNRAVLAQALAAVVPTLADREFFEALVDEATRMAAPAWVGNARALARTPSSPRPWRVRPRRPSRGGASRCWTTSAIHRWSRTPRGSRRSWGISWPASQPGADRERKETA
jgi:pimeloyl-ACP methyl ester carboxylesterase